MWYKGNKRRCEEYNAIVSFGEKYEGIPNDKPIPPGQEKRKGGGTNKWAEPLEIDGNYYIPKHPNYEGTYLTEIVELPTSILI